MHYSAVAIYGILSNTFNHIGSKRRNTCTFVCKQNIGVFAHRQADMLGFRCSQSIINFECIQILELNVVLGSDLILV